MNGRDYTADPVPVPSEYPWLETDVPEEEAVVPDVLNPADNLHIPVTDGVELSGIGWIDGNMHVQIHISDYMVQVEKEEIFYEFARYACIVTMWSPDTTARIQDSPGYVRKIEWREGNDLWIEQIFPVQPYEMSEYSIDAEFTFLRANIEDLLQYVWEVSFPANMIQVIPE